MVTTKRITFQDIRFGERRQDQNSTYIRNYWVFKCRLKSQTKVLVVKQSLNDRFVRLAGRPKAGLHGTDGYIARPFGRDRRLVQYFRSPWEMTEYGDSEWDDTVMVPLVCNEPNGSRVPTASLDRLIFFVQHSVRKLDDWPIFPSMDHMSASVNFPLVDLLGPNRERVCKQPLFTSYPFSLTNLILSSFSIKSRHLSWTFLRLDNTPERVSCKTRPGILKGILRV